MDSPGWSRSHLTCKTHSASGRRAIGGRHLPALLKARQ
ncbi:hypothetical protein F5I99_08870 [Nitrincola iocasae]|uniref:Uncharacterized protein n=1 Tax=Nitrincola iocasae TaxID=2614693 RepID=A0A5J6LDB2_9GAMM|nr:hypothetical protein F5I99_08870 [Nitrincola iocasae]